MRPLLRRAFNFAAAASLALSLGTCVLWARSYPHAERLYFGPGYRLRSESGWLSGGPPALGELSEQVVAALKRRIEPRSLADLVWRPPTTAPQAAPPPPPIPPRPNPWLPRFRLPYPVVAVAFSLLPVMCAARYRKRPAAGYCIACGYDLRATPEAGGALLDRCPECGRIPERRTAT